MTMAMPAQFDPLVDFDGLWTTELADHYLPLLDLPEARYECIDGRLVVSPTEVNSNSRGGMKLGQLITPTAEAAGYHVSGPVNLTFSPGLWIVPDVTVLHTLPQNDHEDQRVPSSYVIMPVEFVSRSYDGRKRDFIDKPKRCADAGIPYFMRIQIVRQLRSVEVELLKLIDGRYEPLVGAAGGQEFVTSEPFEMGFTPRALVP